MKLLVIVGLFFITFGANAQKLKFKVHNLKDTTVFLVKYYGKGMYYADTAQMKNGSFEFDASKQKPGVMAILFPGQKYFDFIYNKEEIQIESTAPEYPTSLVVKKSEENKIFAEYVKFLAKQRTLVNDLNAKRTALKKEDPQYKELGEKMDALSKEVLKYQNDLVKNQSNLFVSKVVKMSMDVVVPDSPRDAAGKLIDSTFTYRYYRDHYFENIDLKDDRIINTPMFHNKLDDFFSKKMLLQIPDTVVKYAYWFCDQLDQKSELFKYCTTHITSTYEKSPIMNMDKVFVRMGERYYCANNAEGKSPAYWMEEDKLKDLCDKVTVNRHLIQGERPPNVSLRDTTDAKWQDYYSLKSDYTVLYFWDADCGHCKTSTPKLQKLYEEKLKARGVEVFAVAKAVGDDEFVKWKKFIKEKNLTFINVGLTDKLYKEAKEDARLFIPKYTSLEALNYQETFDIFSTPRLFVLDKDKKILAKQLSISQLEDFMDNIQKVKSPKIIAPDEEKEKEGDKEKQQH